MKSIINTYCDTSHNENDIETDDETLFQVKLNFFKHFSRVANEPEPSRSGELGSSRIFLDNESDELNRPIRVNSARVRITNTA